MLVDFMYFIAEFSIVFSMYVVIYYLAARYGKEEN